MLPTGSRLPLTVSDKFFTYGGPDFTLDTELKGHIIAIAGVNLYVAPYRSYYHLLLEGNHRNPVPGEGGYDWYRRNILSQGEPPSPIIKLEVYEVGGRPAGAVLLPAKQLRKLINNAVLVMTEMRNRRESWRGELLGLRQQARRLNRPFDIEFFESILSVLDGQYPRLPDGHPYEEAIKEIQTQIKQ